MAPTRPASLKVRALQWLAQREHSRSELRDKLLRLLRRSHAEQDEAGGADARCSDPAAEVEAVLVWLEQHGHLSDVRFTDSRVHARQARFGNRRIQQELQQHGIRLDAEARQALAKSELARAAALWQRKYGAIAADAAGRMRQMRFLAGRGFSMDVVHRVVQGGALAVGASEDGG
jgi:regulatory protein